jgi:hypothetical protein
MIAAEAQANANLNTAINASAANSQSTQTQTSTTQTTTAAVIPTGAITWAPGFGPNGAVASVQTAPTTTATETASNGTAVAGVQTAPQSGSAVAGVSNLPSTNTGDSTGVLGLGAALMALGVYLVRLPTKSRK